MTRDHNLQTMLHMTVCELKIPFVLSVIKTKNADHGTDLAITVRLDRCGQHRSKRDCKKCCKII